jgi:hypothetical protein
MRSHEVHRLRYLAGIRHGRAARQTLVGAAQYGSLSPNLTGVTLPRVTESPEQRLRELLHHGDQAAWTTAALVLSLRNQAPTPLADAARQVLTTLGLDLPTVLAGRDSAAAAAQAAAPLPHQRGST